MAVGIRQVDQLQMSWNGAGPVLWATDGAEGTDVAGQLVLRSLVTMLFGYDGLALLGTAVTPLYLPQAGHAVADRASSRATYAPSLQAFAHTAAPFFRDHEPVDDASASVRWMMTAADLGTRMAQAGLIAPQVRKHTMSDGAASSVDPSLPTGWEADWCLRHTPEADRAIDGLAAQVPPAVWAPLPAPPPATEVAAIVQYFANTLARWALTIGGWRPDLGRSTRAEAVVARRVATALRDEPTVEVSTRDQETAVGAIGVALDQRRVSADAGLGFRSRARLSIPDQPTGDANTDLDPQNEDAQPEAWPVSFEVVLTDDPTITYSWAELAAGAIEPSTTPGGVVVSEAALTVMTRQVAALAGVLAEHVPQFAALTAERGLVLLDLDQVTQLLAQRVDQCAALGCPLLVPKELAPKTVRVNGTARVQEPGGPSADLGQTMVDVDWRLALGGRRLTDAELSALAEAKADLVQLRGQWIRIDTGQVAGALQQLDRHRSGKSMTPAQFLRLAATADAAGDDDQDGAAIELVADDDEERTSADGWLADLMAGLPDDRLAEADEPDGFVGQLRPYQRRAVGWLGFLARLGLGGCLADDMGLGKTPTTLAHLAANPGDRPNLVICPLSVVHNWEAEAAAFTPKFRVLIAHGASRSKGEDFAQEVAEADLVISTYGTVTRDIETMSADRWNIVVCDEAQAIKNQRTKAARAIRALDARQLVALTGTPVENRLTELWAILDAVNPGSLGGVGWFRDTFATPIESKQDEDALAGMKRLTGPFVLRRTKADKSLVPDLPDKVEQVAWAALTDEQAGLYQAVLDDFLARLDGGDDEDGEDGEASPGDALLGGGDNNMQRRGLVLATLTRLKQICNHPAQFLAAGGEEPGRLPNRSGKLNRFDELVTELLDADERALIFTQYREMGELLAAHVAQAHQVPARFLHGGVSRTGREEMVRDFQSGDGPPLQIISLKAGGTGLNLTAASRVIHYDRWWNPAVEDQATDRAWRIGQQSTVFVHKLVCRGTLEERIDALLVDKKALAQSAVSTGEAWLTEMTTDQLRGLFRLDRGAEGGAAR